MSNSIQDNLSTLAGSGSEVTVVREKDGREFTGKLVLLADRTDDGEPQYAVRTGKQGRPYVAVASAVREVRVAA